MLLGQRELIFGISKVMGGRPPPLEPRLQKDKKGNFSLNLQVVIFILFQDGGHKWREMGRNLTFLPTELSETQHLGFFQTKKTNLVRFF